MISVDEFIKNLKPLPKEKTIRPLTSEDIETKKNIIEYLVNHKSEVNYSERIFNKLECILTEMLGGK